LKPTDLHVEPRGIEHIRAVSRFLEDTTVDNVRLHNRRGDLTDKHDAKEDAKPTNTEQDQKTLREKTQKAEALKTHAKEESKQTKEAAKAAKARQDQAKKAKEEKDQELKKEQGEATRLKKQSDDKKRKDREGLAEKAAEEREQRRKNDVVEKSDKARREKLELSQQMAAQQEQQKEEQTAAIILNNVKQRIQSRTHNTTFIVVFDHEGPMGIEVDPQHSQTTVTGVDPNGFSMGKSGIGNLQALGDERFDNPEAPPYYVQTLRIAVGDHVVNVNGHDIEGKPAAEGLPYIAGARWPRTLTFLRQEIIKEVEEKYLGDPVRLFLEWPPICKGSFPLHVAGWSAPVKPSNCVLRPVVAPQNGDNEACGKMEPSVITTGAIAYAYRGVCTFMTKLENLNSTLPDSALILNIESDHETIDMPRGSLDVDTFPLPSMMLSKANGELLHLITKMTNRNALGWIGLSTKNEQCSLDGSGFSAHSYVQSALDMTASQVFDAVQIPKADAMDPTNRWGGWIQVWNMDTDMNLQFWSSHLGDNVISEPKTLTVAKPRHGCVFNQWQTNVGGKIVLLERGKCSFLDKLKNAQARGAVGVIIVSNQDDEVFNIPNPDKEKVSNIYMGMVHKKEGTALMALVEKRKKYLVRMYEQRREEPEDD